MLRVLTLATLFPDARRPTLGVFVERQTIGLAERDDVTLEVVSPLGLPPWPLSLHPHYAPRRNLPFEEDWKGLKVHRPRFSPFPARLQPEAIARAARPIAEAFRPEVIDAEFFWPDGPAAMHLARALDIPFSVKARGADIHYWASRPAIGVQILKAAKAADGLLAVSAALKADMGALGMPADRIKVHHTGVDLDLFHPGAEAPIGIDGPLVVTAGALIARKRPELVLEVARRVPEATFLFVGDGPQRARLERAAGPNVRFAGAQPHEALPGFLAAADVMLLPSRSEGLANVWVEALACGTPLVLTDAGGAREAVTSPEAGHIVAPEPQALAEAVRALIASPPDRAAVRRAAQGFSWERNAVELGDYLAGLVNRGSEPRR
jgi:glycosyltransferase involved in cell wall biosynthesis